MPDPGGIDEMQHFAPLGQNKSTEGAAILRRDRGQVKVRIDVPVRIENVFAEPRHSTRSDPVELRADQTAGPADLVTNRTVSLENRRAVFDASAFPESKDSGPP